MANTKSKNATRIQIKSDDFFVSNMLITLERNNFERKKFIPTSEVNHLESYKYITPNGEKFSCVFDTKAKILTIDATSNVLDEIMLFLPQDELLIHRSKNAINNNNQKQSEIIETQPTSIKNTPIVQAPKALAKQANKSPIVQAPKALVKKPTKSLAVQATNDIVLSKSHEIMSYPSRATDLITSELNSIQYEPIEYQSGEYIEHIFEQASKLNEPTNKAYVLKKFDKTRFEWVINRLKESGKCKIEKSFTDKGDIIYVITNDSKEKISLSYSTQRTLSLQGKQSALYNETLFELERYYDQTLLKKLLPTGIKFLSEQSKIDLYNGITDLKNVNRLSDFSVLLVAPYRALEKLIYDLQQAENISVKMIGQAYEKDDLGNYNLKKGYRKRINSIVYAEVLSDLYTEYFATRNFYTHSDNSIDSQTRAISTKQEATAKLNKLIEKIEYDCKKLTEINFNHNKNKVGEK